MKISILITVLLIVMISVYSCSKEDTIITPTTNDTLSYIFDNLNDSLITISYAVAGSTTSQSKMYTLNLNKSPLNERFNMTHITNGSMTINLYYITSTDTLKRQPFTLSAVRDSIRNNITGPVNRVEIVPTNFKGRGTLYIFK